MKMGAIRNLAKSLEINSFAKTKVDLVRSIQRRQGHFVCFATVKEFCDQGDCCFKAACFDESKKITRKSAS